MRNSKPERLGGLEGRAVVAAFDAGAVTSDAAARAIRMMDRLASCFDDGRCPELIEHQVVTLVLFGIALGYEDLNDHDELRHDPMLAVLSGKLAAGREDCAPVAGKSTLTLGRRGGGGGAHRRPDSPPLAAGAHSAAR